MNIFFYQYIIIICFHKITKNKLYIFDQTIKNDVLKQLFHRLSKIKLIDIQTIILNAFGTGFVCNLMKQSIYCKVLNIKLIQN